MATQGYGNQEASPPGAAPSQTKRKSDEVTGRKDPPSKTEEQEEINTPGDGAGPSPAPGGETDPGVG